MALVLTAALAYVAWATLDNWDTSQQNARQIQSNAQRYERERCVGLDVIGGIECITKTREAAADQERDEADLYAQRQMAVWAFLVAVTAFVSVPLSLTGIFFVWRSLNEMKEQRLSSQAAVKAAIQSNKTSQRLADAEMGAKLRFVKGTITVSESGIFVFLTMKNVGKTMALDIASSSYGMFFEPFEPWTVVDIPDPIVIQSSHINRANTGIPVGETGSFMTVFIRLDELPKSMFENLMERPRSVNVRGKITWRTLFELEHTLEVQYESGTFRTRKNNRGEVDKIAPLRFNVRGFNQRDYDQP